MALAILLACAPGASLAQLPTGRSGFSTDRSPNAREYWSAVRDFGRCFIRRQERDALALLSTQPESREEQAVLTILFRGETNCTDMRLLTFLSRHVRGAFAEGMILDGKLIPARLSLTAPASVADVRTLSDAARCYAAAHATEVRALITDTRPGSEEELAALERMDPDFRRCLPPAGQASRFPATDLRYRLAESLLRLGPTGPEPAH
jgi:hypothetical protein